MNGKRRAHGMSPIVAFSVGRALHTVGEGFRGGTSHANLVCKSPLRTWGNFEGSHIRSTSTPVRLKANELSVVRSKFRQGRGNRDAKAVAWHRVWELKADLDDL